MKAKIKIILAVLVACALVFLLRVQWQRQDVVENENTSVQEITPEPTKRYATVVFQGVTIHVQIARTDTERQKGLSGTEGLKEKEGMLFIFNRPSKYGFWMPDMNYAIDIVWLDENFVVVDVKENATPESYPEVFRPRSEALYVLEVPSGFATKSGITIGSKAELKDIAE